MSQPTPGSESSKAPRSYYTACAASCPLLLLGLYGYLGSEQGTRSLDALASRNFLTGMMVIVLPVVVMAAIVIIGFATSIRAVRRREKPAWAAWIVLAVNAAILMVALVFLIDAL